MVAQANSQAATAWVSEESCRRANYAERCKIDGECHVLRPECRLPLLAPLTSSMTKAAETLILPGRSRRRSWQTRRSSSPRRQGPMSDVLRSMQSDARAVTTAHKSEDASKYSLKYRAHAVETRAGNSDRVGAPVPCVAVYRGLSWCANCSAAGSLSA